ncbi:MAG: Hpt domain-containing protein, partial [bacterium]
MDMEEYMSMFLDESKENLQNLNDSLLKLENAPDDMALLDEIFRVAHTLKGMSATMGFTSVAELTHEMENVLDKLRKGEMHSNSDIIDILFQCLDTLEGLITSIAEDGELEDTTELTNKLRSLSSGGAAASVPSRGETSAAVAKAEEADVETDDGNLNEFEKEVIMQADEKGYDAYHIKVILEENCLLKAARVYMVFRELEELGDIVKSIPEVKTLEEGEFNDNFEVYLVTRTEKDIVEEKVYSVSEVEQVEIHKVALASPSTAAKPEVVNPQPAAVAKEVSKNPPKGKAPSANSNK